MNNKIILLQIIILGSIIWNGVVDSKAASSGDHLVDNTPLKIQAFNILEHKCNVCHRKKNPFMVFNMKNMDKRAEKIDKMVFVYKRMPKGDDIKLTSEERETLKSWIQSLNTK